MESDYARQAAAARLAGFAVDGYVEARR